MENYVNEDFHDDKQVYNDYVNTNEISYQLNDSPHAHNCATQRTLWAAEWHFSCNETERQNQQTDRSWLTLKME